MTTKPWGPGYKTGAEGDAMEAGNTSHYPGAESPGKSIGGDDSAPNAQGSNVPSRPNPQSGNLSEVKRTMTDAVDEAAAYGGHGVSQGGENQTGSNINNPEGERTGHDDGVYGDRQATPKV